MLTDGRVTGEQLRQLRWELKPEGLCRDEQCVIVAPDERSDDGSLSASLIAECLGMPLLNDEESGVSALGPEVGRPPFSQTHLPDLTLADFDGNPFNLSALRGRKSLLVAWASW